MENKDSKTDVLAQAISMLIRGFEEQKKVKINSIKIKNVNNILLFDTRIEYDEE